MIISYNGVPMPTADDSFGFTRTLDTETGALAEVVDIPFDLISLDGSVDDAIEMLTELRAEHSPQFNEGLRLVHFSDWDDVTLTLEGRRTLLPGDEHYPETFTPALDGIYPDRTWRDAGPEISNSGFTHAVIQLDDLKGDLEMESYLIDIHRLVENQREDYATAMHWVFSLNKERENLGIGPNVKVRFGVSTKQKVVIAQIFDAPGAPTYKVSDLPDDAVELPALLHYVKSGVARRQYGNVTIEKP